MLAGDRGAKRDIVLLNAGAAIYVGGKAATFKDGLALAAGSIDSGAAANKLDELITLSNRLAKA